MAPTLLERAPSALAAGRDLWLKREDRHELCAFKWRGALPVLARFAAEKRAAAVTASTGNHGAATAWAGSRAGSRCRCSRRAGRARRSSQIVEVYLKWTYTRTEIRDFSWGYAGERVGFPTL